MAKKTTTTKAPTKTAAKSATPKPAAKTAPKPKGEAAAKTERARKQAIAQIDQRLAEQEHEVPTQKERANDAANEAHGATLAPKARKAPPKPAPTPKDAAPANVAAHAGQSAGKRVSALDAAAQVLAEAPAEGLGAKDLIAELKTRGLWSSPGGKTPAATLYAAMLREINAKGDQARFRKVGRGRFVLAAR